MTISFFSMGARGAWWFPAMYRAYYERVLSDPRAAKQRIKITAAETEMAALVTEAFTSFASVEANSRAFVPDSSCAVLAAWAKNDRIVQWKRSEPAMKKSFLTYA